MIGCSAASAAGRPLSHIGWRPSPAATTATPSREGKNKARFCHLYFLIHRHPPETHAPRDIFFPAQDRCTLAPKYDAQSPSIT
eukprot:scaffold8153_cov149-Isochrysis_galbana.AAC.2